MEIDLLFRDLQKYIQDDLGTEQWVTVYSYESDESRRFGYYSALIPNGMVDDILDCVSWDLAIGEGRPTHIYYGAAEKPTYVRFACMYDGVEPLVFHRSYHGIREAHTEVSEEFRHYHNLYYDAQSSKYISVDSSGDENDVIALGENSVKIKLKYLKEFLAVKRVHLAIYFDLVRYSPKSLQDLGIDIAPTRIKEGKYIYSISFTDRDSGSGSLSRLLGKKLIEGLKDFKPDHKEDKEYIDFIIGVDGDGKEIYHTCDPEQLGEPNYLTLVFFRMEVLNEYYANTTKFSVEDGYLSCGVLWSLRMDNNHPKYIIVYLGDLGGLSTKHQHHWRRYNIVPEGGISPVAYRRDVVAEFTDAERSDLLFKSRFKIIQRKWLDKFGWHPFKPLSKKDEHLHRSLRIPLTDDQSEFDQQALVLTKIIIDSLNEAELGKPITKDKGDKGITKLEKYFAHNQSIGYEVHIRFLRNLQDLRDGAAHRKGKQYQRGSEYFRLEENTLSVSFDHILGQFTNIISCYELA